MKTLFPTRHSRKIFLSSILRFLLYNRVWKLFYTVLFLLSTLLAASNNFADTPEFFAACMAVLLFLLAAISWCIHVVTWSNPKGIRRPLIYWAYGPAVMAATVLMLYFNLPRIVRLTISQPYLLKAAAATLPHADKPAISEENRFIGLYYVCSIEQASDGSLWFLTTFDAVPAFDGGGFIYSPSGNPPPLMAYSPGVHYISPIFGKWWLWRADF